MGLRFLIPNSTLTIELKEQPNWIYRVSVSANCHYRSSPSFTGDKFQDLQWMPETMGSTKP